MAIEFGCPSCGGTLRVEDDAVGQVVRCGGCMTMLRVPEKASSPPPFPDSTDNPFPGAEPLPSLRKRLPIARPQEEPAQIDDPIEQSPRLPRRRRNRQEPPQPPGRSPLFWVMITLCILGFGSCVFCCGVVFLLPGANWQTHQSNSGGFEVDLPSEPKKAFSLSNLNHDQSQKIEGTRLLVTEEEYAILYKDIEPSDKRRVKDNQLLDQAVKDLERSIGVQKQGEVKSLDVSGFPAREIKFQLGEDGMYIVRVIVADSRMYTLVAGSRMKHPVDENVERFFNSFKITDEKLLAVVNGRVERNHSAVLGKALAETLIHTLSTENELACLKELGTVVTKAPFQTIALEKSEKERATVAELGKALAGIPLQAIAAEQLLIAEQNRVGKIGITIGNAVTSAIKKVLANFDEP